MGSKRKQQEISSNDEIKIVPQYVEKNSEASTDLEATAAEGDSSADESTDAAPVKKKVERHRSAKYQAVRAQVDKTKKYSPAEAIALVKKLSYTAFDGTLTAHIVVKEAGLTFSLAMPHSTGKALRVAIVDDALLADVAAGKIEFDILIASPEYMPKLAKFASVLGPKGLMPNPKNGTLTKDVTGAKKKLEAGTVTLKTEKKAPLLHVRLGKVSMDSKELTENVVALIQSTGLKTVSVVIAASMSPGVKVEFANLIA